MSFIRKKKIWMRAITAVLVVALLGTGMLSSMAAVTIVGSDKRSEAAVNYLVDNSEYLRKNRVERMGDVLSTMGSEKTLEDYYTLAATQIASEDYLAAANSLSKCLQLHENKKDELYLDLLMKQGCINVMLGKYNEALKYLDMALAIDPGLSDAYLIKAQIYSEKGNLVLLASSLESYLKKHPEDTEIRGLLAQTNFLQADYQQAKAEYEKILKSKNDPQILYLNGLTQIQLGEFATAEKQLTEAIKQNDTYDGIYYYRGVCRMANKDYQQAIEDFTTSIQKKSMTQASHYTRGVCSLMTEDYNLDTVVSDLKTAESGTEADVAKQSKDLLQKLKEAKDAAEAAKEAQKKLEDISGSTEGAITNSEPEQTEERPNQ